MKRLKNSVSVLAICFAALVVMAAESECGATPEAGWAAYPDAPTPTAAPAPTAAPEPAASPSPTAAAPETVLQVDPEADSELDLVGTCMEDVMRRLVGIGVAHGLGTSDSAVNDQWVADFESCIDALDADGLLLGGLIEESRGLGRAILDDYLSDVEVSVADAGPVRVTNGIGDTVRLGDMDVTVNGVRADSGTEFFEPDEGHAFVYVDVTFQNHGSDPAALSALLQMKLTDADGWVYSVDLSATAAGDNPSSDGEVAPGAVRRGELGYQVPVGATGLTWAFSGDLFSAGEAVFELGEIPDIGLQESAT